MAANMTQVLIVVLFLFVMFAMPFSKPVRRVIFARDNATCRWCGKKWSDGWMLHCAHIDHNKAQPHYDNPENGRLLCVDCHILDHEQRLASAKTKKERNLHAYAIRKLDEWDRHNIHYYK